MKKINEKELRKKLTAIYEAYVEGKVNNKIRKLADRIYSDYWLAEPIIDPILYKAICSLDEIAWPEIIEKTSRPPLPKEEAKKILEELKRMDEKAKKENLTFTTKDNKKKRIFYDNEE
ncbi:MAG: hypothetical protein QXS41_04130 [Candidatus Woesearchaeota archaeon]